MKQFAIFAQRNGEHLGKVYAAHRIAHKEARSLRCVHIALGPRWFLWRRGSQPIGMRRPMRRKPHEKMTIQNRNLTMRAKKFIGFLRNTYQRLPSYR